MAFVLPSGRGAACKLRTPKGCCRTTCGHDHVQQESNVALVSGNLRFLLLAFSWEAKCEDAEKTVGTLKLHPSVQSAMSDGV